MPQEQGLRFNEGKLRYDLVPAYAQQQYVQVLTKGAQKYAPRNWEKGMAWSKVIASLKRHLAAIEGGQDYDVETGELHSAHLMCNAAFLTEYYKVYPQGDDRPHHYLNPPRIGLDVDEVLAGFAEAYCAKYALPVPTSWNFDYQLLERFKEAGPAFWAEFKPKLDPRSLPFEPAVYVSTRSIGVEVTQHWLQQHGFPTAPVVHTKNAAGKVAACQEYGVDIFVDDHYDNFVALNQAGICCYLMDATHNQRYQVGHKRLLSLIDLPFFN